jgi:hypothetical protein
VRTDFGKSANSSAIEGAGEPCTDFGNTAKSCAKEFAGVNKSACSAA